MKLFNVILPAIFIIGAVQVSAQTDEQATKQAIDERKFTFHATRANPMETNTLNQIFNSMPNARENMLNLSGSRYDVKITKDSVVAFLPYFGRSFNPSMNPNDAGTKFNSKDFTYTSVKKKNRWIITINPKDVRDSQQLVFNISEDGYATLNVNNYNRQSISFFGYLSEGENKDRN